MKQRMGTKFVYELEYVFLNRVQTGGEGQGTSPFVSQVFPIECDKDGEFLNGVVLTDEGDRERIAWKPGETTVIPAGWIWRHARIIEVPIYESKDPTVSRGDPLTDIGATSVH